MPYEQKDMQGSLFKNDKKETDKQPNARGACMIDGVEYWISAWTKKTKDGDPWQSLAFERKEQQRGPSRKAESDIPF